MELQISQNVVISNTLLNIMNDLMFVRLVAIEWFNGMWGYDCQSVMYKLSPPLLVCVSYKVLFMYKMEMNKVQ
jgi:hypothetical protein